MRPVAVVGAGFTGAIIARELADAGYTVTVFEKRNHVAGNCYTYRDPQSGIMVHAYGPHIFHTSNKRVWDYITKWDEFMPYVQRTKAVVDGQVYSLPINLHTINQFFGSNFSPKEAMEHVCKGNLITQMPTTFREQALKFVGAALYGSFLEGYTEKQWGVSPSELPASIMKRLPLRFNYDDSYFDDVYQAMPRHGYTAIIERMLNHHRIRVRLNTPFCRQMKSAYDHVFWSGPLDGWFDYTLGRLGYRSLKFKYTHAAGDYQGCAVMNYCDREVAYTRVTEHKFLAPWEPNPEHTVVFHEYSVGTTPELEPFYPIRLVNDKKLLGDYVEMAEAETNVSFVGRLGTYRYLDMHVAMAEALDAAASFLNRKPVHARIPPFMTKVL